MDTMHRILDLIWRNGLSEIEFCQKAGINRSAVTDWKKGKTKSYMKHIPKIAEVLGVSVDYLLEPEKNPMDITREEAKEIVRQTKNRDVIIINEFGSDGDNKSYEISKEDWEEIKELQRIIKQRVRQRKEKE